MVRMYSIGGEASRFYTAGTEWECARSGMWFWLGGLGGYVRGRVIEATKAAMLGYRFEAW